jgi:hypothetical protein
MIEWIQLFFLQSVKKRHFLHTAGGLTRENGRYRDEINSTFHVAEVLLLGGQRTEFMISTRLLLEGLCLFPKGRASFPFKPNPFNHEKSRSHH